MKIAVAGGTGVVGRHVVGAADAQGHETVVLSRGAGVDLIADDTAALVKALEGVEVIVDASNVNSMNGAKATKWFTTATRNLQQSGAKAGVARLVTLSIVNIDKLSGNPYYSAKLAQEQAALEGPLPVTILRATQFHEFSAQVMQRIKVGPIRLVPRFRVQTVAARSVGAVAVELAVWAPDATTIDLAGPVQADLVDQARAIAKRTNMKVRIVGVSLPGRTGRALKSGGLTPSDPGQARIEGPAFDEWLRGDDVEAVVGKVR